MQSMNKQHSYFEGFDKFNIKADHLSWDSTVMPPREGHTFQNYLDNIYIYKGS